ncbi:MAG: hypothetical protein KA586_03560 [Candidatus Promineofilum sp.]|nr:hypothetical protein [Promineifilum sp.]
MRANSLGILTDSKSRVFLQQSGRSTLVPLQRPLEPGLLPAQTLDRAFREDTSLIVMPVRLTGLYYDPNVADGELTFCFRCTMRGGDLKVPPGGQPAGFFDWPLQAGGLSPKYSRMVDDALHHAGGPPILAEAGGPSASLGRLLGRQSVERGAESWRIAVRVTDEANDDMIEWVVVGPNEGQPDPATPAGPARPPWETAMRLADPRHAAGGLHDVRLVGVEIASEQRTLTLVFAMGTDH